MDLSNAWLLPTWAFALPIAAAIPLGWWMWRVLDVPPGRDGRGLDAVPRAMRRVLIGREPARSDWKAYAFALLAFNAMLFALSFLLLSLQPHLPLNPDAKGPMSGDLVFNTVCSFVTNTNLQHYSGEQSLSYFSQLGVIAWLQFVTPASGLCVMLAAIRGLRGDEHLGDFYLDLARILCLVFVPMSLVVAVLLVACGVPMTFEGAAMARTLEGGEQVIARGPVAAEVAIKQLGTNGGGYFGPNSTHPFENPSPWSNMIEMVSILLLPMGTIALFGFMLRDGRHAGVVFGVMLTILVGGATFAILAEVEPNAATAGLAIEPGPNMEGKEVRIGPVGGATWAAFTTATSNGSVSAMHDSLNPLAGMVPMGMMMLNVVFSGIGAGFLNMVSYIIVAVFLAGLMVGRTPEYLGKKLEAKEVKLAMLAILLHPLLICGGSALFAATSWGRETVNNPGPHGFSEIVYEFSSAAANNGSGFEGLGDNTPPWNIATGIVLLLGRFPAMIFPLAIAGFLSQKRRVPQTSGTLRTSTLTFAVMLLGTVILVGALAFLPTVVLGPVADHLSTFPPLPTP
ncbi:potassium-transporting ATPase subunit KdpA [Tautonia sp. JC769]|uniref:potassium-transporting ATPase subunit KdpA n=1 Tax=Tautonia sp. JC769 TaxID=3232135 RepID=UPI003457BD40